MTRCLYPRQAGFTLLEVVIAAAILSLAVAALTQAVVAGQMQTYAALGRERAVSLGESMIEEILSKPYPDPGAGGGAEPTGAKNQATRTGFDAMDDYDGFAQAAGALTTASGRRYPQDQQGDSIRVSVKPASAPAVIQPGQPRAGLMLKVTVSAPNTQAITLTRFVPQPHDALEGS